MSRSILSRLLTSSGVLVAAIVMASGASAETYVGLAGGVLVPWDGGTGYSIMGELGGNVGSDYFMLGGEFTYSSLDKSVDIPGVGPTDVGLRTYDLRAMFRFVFLPGKISPYIGFGGGLTVIDVDDKLFSQNPIVPAWAQSASTVGIGGGLIGLGGIEIPLFTPRFVLFGEARFGYTWEFTSNIDPLFGGGDYSGFSGIGGLRARF